MAVMGSSTHLTILKLICALDSPVSAAVAALQYRFGLPHWYSRGEQSIAEDTGHNFVLSCQSALFAVVEGHRGVVDTLVEGCSLELSAVDANCFCIFAHCYSRLEEHGRIRRQQQTMERAAQDELWCMMAMMRTSWKQHDDSPTL